MKNVFEVNGFAASIVDAIFQALEDGKLTISDIPAFMTPIFKATPAIDDISEVGKENAAATKDQKDELQADFLRSMPNVPGDIADDISRIVSGLWAAYRVGYKIGKDSGKEEGRAALVDDIRSGRVAVSDLIDNE